MAECVKPKPKSKQKRKAPIVPEVVTDNLQCKDESKSAGDDGNNSNVSAHAINRPISDKQCSKNVEVGLEASLLNAVKNKSVEVVSEDTEAVSSCEEPTEPLNENHSKTNLDEVVIKPTLNHSAAQLEAQGVSEYQSVVEDLEKLLQVDSEAPTAPSIDIGEVTPSLDHDKIECKLRLPKTEHIVDLIKDWSIEKEIIDISEPLSELENSLFAIRDAEIECTELIDSIVKKSVPPTTNFFQLLSDYQKYLSNDEKFIVQTNNLQEEARVYKNEVWTVWPDIKIQERGFCLDKNEVTFTHSCQTARFNYDAHELQKSALLRLRTHIFQEQWPNRLKGHICKASIEMYLYELATSCREFKKLDSRRTVSSQCPSTDSYFEKCLSQLCSTIETFFYFQRSVNITDNKEFISQTRRWLTNLIALLVRIGSWKEFVFVLCHVLRCPNGIADWAVIFIQCPKSALCVAIMLQIILRPVKDRAAFLQGAESWVVVDSEGDDNESSELNDNDMNALLNQVPLGSVLQAFLATDIRDISEMSFLQLLAFMTAIVPTIRSGLETYAEKLKPFGKRLGKLCRQLLEFASDQLELLSERGFVSQKLQKKFDYFFIETAKCILAAPSAWQFLAGAPFHQISASAKWRLYGELQLSECDHSNLVEFECKFTKIPEDERIYLLTTLCNIVLARGEISPKLVRCIAYQIFYVGFLSISTRETMYKNASNLLATIIERHGHLVSEILGVQDHYFNNIEDQSLSVTLWLEMNLASWVPNVEDFSILKKWILKSPKSNCSNLARTILKLINYEFVDFELRRDMSLALVEVSDLYTDSALCDWIWTYLCRLPLHVADRFLDGPRQTAALVKVPDLVSLADLRFLVDKGNPVACFVALLLTDIGHSVPVIYRQGFSAVKVLISHRKYEACFHCIELMAVMFWDCPDSLISCSEFLEILNEILSSDNTYLKMAKNMITQDFPGPVLKKFTMMLYYHLNRMEGILVSKAVNLWTCCLIRTQSWTSSQPALYLLDIVCRRAFFIPEAWRYVLEALEGKLNSILSSEPKSPMSAIMKFINSPQALPSILSRGCDGNVPWFSYAVLSLEFEIFERRTNVWNSLIQDISDRQSSAKVSIDGSLKKVCSALNVPIRPASSLCLYRWANQILETSVSHPLCILLWHRFIELYLARVPGVVDRGCAGQCFFSSNRNSSLKNKLIARLNETAKAQPDLEVHFKAFSKWLTTEQILELRFSPFSLNANCSPNLLTAILSGDREPWLLLLPNETLSKDWKQDASLWMQLFCRCTKGLPKNPLQVTNIPVHIRINKRLQELTSPLNAPDVHHWSRSIKYDSNFKACDLNVSQTMKHIVKCVKNNLKHWNSISKSHSAIASATEILYVGHDRYLKQTKNCHYKDRCAGSCTLTLKFKNWEMDEKQASVLEKNEGAMYFTISDALKEVNERLGTLCYSLPYVAKKIREELNACKRSSQERTKIIDSGTCIFQEILIEWSEEINQCGVVRDVVSQCLNILGQNCVVGNAKFSKTLFDLVKNKPSLDFLNLTITPNVDNPQEFVVMYGAAITAIAKLLHWFDVDDWLKTTKPSCETLQKLLSVVFIGAQVPNQSLKSVEVLGKHLQCLLMHTPSDMFIPALNEILAASRKQRIPLTIWIALLNALCPAIVGNSVWKTIAKDLTTCAKQQRLLSQSELRRVAKYLADCFEAEARRKKSMYSIYINYFEPISILMGVIFESAVLSNNESAPEQPIVEFVEREWTALFELFHQWLIPKNEFVSPFEAKEAAAGSFCAMIFAECIRFLCQIRPGAEVVLNHVWRCYSSHFCQEKISGLLLSTIHSSLSVLPWTLFVPSLQDVECMLQILGQPLKVNHNFIANIFLSIDWIEVINRSYAMYGNEINSKLHVCFLHILVKFSSESTLKSSKAFQAVIDKASEISWHLVDASSFNSIVSWFCMTCDPVVILLESPMDTDSCILKLLQKVAGYDSGIKFFHPTTQMKRQIFVAMCVKFIATAQSSKKRKCSSSIFESAIAKLFNDMDATLTATLPAMHQYEEIVILLHEMLKLLGEFKIAKEVETSMLKWISNANSKLVIGGLLLTAGRAIEVSAYYATIVEACLEQHFAIGSRDWNEVIPVVAPYTKSTIDSVLIAQSSFLTLYATIRQRLGSNLLGPATRPSLNQLLQMLANVKPSIESEPKLILLIVLLIQLISTQPDAVALLKTLTDTLLSLTVDRTASLLSTLGFKKSPSPSIEFKLACIVSASVVSRLLASEYKHTTDERAMDALTRAETNKAFQPILGHLFAAKNALKDKYDVPKLVSFVYNLGAQLFSKLYFTL